jgi:signal transduction histidine kinase
LFRFRRIRSKLIASFAAPLAVLVVVAVVEVVAGTSQIGDVNRQTALATTSVGPGGVVQALQNEREEAVLSVLAAAKNLPIGLQGITPAAAGLNGTAASIEAQTDQSVARFETSVRRAGGQVASDYQNSVRTIQEYLGPARHLWQGLGHGSVTDPQARETNVFESYTSIINLLISATSKVPLQVSDSVLRTGVEALDASLNLTEADWTVVQDLFNAVWSAPGAALSTAADQATQDYGAVQSTTQRLSELASGPYASAVNTLTYSTVGQSLQSEGVSLVQQGRAPLLSAILSAFNEPAPQTTATPNPGSSQTLVSAGDSAIAAIVSMRAGQLHNNSVTHAEEFGVLAVATTLLGLVLAVLVSRSISRPLVNLARQAEKLATEELPATVQSILEGEEVSHAPPMDVTSQDEMAEVARALDEVKKTAIELAGGQAGLRRNLAEAFIDLGRRNQNLVTRQLEYISEIELKEADPESLEELFRLDHLATRMRRNAESLLILAGSGPARPWSAPVAAMDVVRAASAEVEDYQRLRLHHFDYALITGSATTDLVHILAELMENALQFSPPGSAVDVYGRLLEEGYVIAIVDSGIGMSPEELAVANARLQGQGASYAVPGRYLGHFVAGRLASSLGIAVALQKSQSGGLVARVKIPGSVLEEHVADLSAQTDRRLTPPEPVTSSSVAETAEASLVVLDAPQVGQEPATAVPALDRAELSHGLAPASGADDLDGAANQGGAAPEPMAISEPGAVPTIGTGLGGAPEVQDAPISWAEQDGIAVGAEPGPEEMLAADDAAVPATPNAPADYEEALPAMVEAVPLDFGTTGHPGVDVTLEAPSLAGDQSPRNWSDLGYRSSETVQAEESPNEPVEPAPETAAPVIGETMAVPGPGETNDGHGWSRLWNISWNEPTPEMPETPTDAPEPVAATAEANAPTPATPVAASPWSFVERATPAPSFPDLSVAHHDLASAGPANPSAVANVTLGPAAQAASTAAGLRKLTRRIPGAALTEQDGSLKRSSPTTTMASPLGLAGALSQYLSATTTSSRPDKEHKD